MKYGLPTPVEIAGKTGKEILQAIIDGKPLQVPICQTMPLDYPSSGSRLSPRNHSVG